MTIENRPLARALYDQVDIDQAVPEEFLKSLRKFWLMYIKRNKSIVNFRFKRRENSMSTRDLSVLISVVLIVAMLVIPFPPWLLSILIIINISLALIVLLTTMNMQEPLQFSIFPSLLLLLTLFRLSLNVSTTRSILSHGEGERLLRHSGISLSAEMCW